MGSAFCCDGLGSRETVLFPTWSTEDNPYVAHMAHPECSEETPHRMRDCGRFEHGESECSIEDEADDSKRVVSMLDDDQAQSGFEEPRSDVQGIGGEVPVPGRLARIGGSTGEGGKRGPSLRAQRAEQLPVREGLGGLQGQTEESKEGRTMKSELDRLRDDARAALRATEKDTTPAAMRKALEAVFAYTEGVRQAFDARPTGDDLRKHFDGGDA